MNRQVHILLIEPDVSLADTYRRALAAADYSVATAGTAQTAIHTADQRRPDIVILELQLMSHSGIEFLYEFRSYDDWREIPVIICSQVPPGEFADSIDDLRTQLGVVNFLYKPRTSLHQLLRAIRSTGVPQV